MTLLRRFTPVVHRLDDAIARLSPRRDILVELRTPVYHAVLAPIAEALAEDPAIQLCYTSESPDRVARYVPKAQFLTHAQAEWRRFDLYLNGDPWAAARLRRCAHRINFFHGVAGKYDLDRPEGLPLGFEYYERVAFINRDRMLRYLDAGIVTTRQAALVGYPKLDKLATGGYDPAKVLASAGLSGGRPVALYAPTYSEASSLHLAGIEIVRALAAVGFDVLVKLHDRSLDIDPRYNGGIDWRARFAALAGESAPARVRLVEAPDSSPLLAAADVMITDHSSIGFEYLVLDRPLIVFDAPDLPRAARINPEKIVLLRSAATVVRTPGETARAAAAAMGAPERLSPARRRIAREMFFEAGGATARAVALARSLIYPEASAGAPVAQSEHGDVS